MSRSTRSFTSFLRCAGVSVLLINTMVSAQAEPLSFDAALALALREAPILAVNEAQLDAARQAAVPAGALPDPRLALGIDNVPIEGPDRFNLNSEAMTMRRIGLMQEFPNRAKRAARVDVARGRVELAGAAIEVTRLLVMRETAVAWIARDTVEQQLEQVDALFAENKLFDAAVRAQLAGGRGMTTEIVMPRQEAAQIEERRDELQARREQAIANLRRWVGTAADSPLVGTVPDWSISSQPLLHGLHRHPEIVLFAPQGRVLDAEVAEAEAAKKSDWALEFAYQNRAFRFGDMVMLQVSFDLPMFTSKRQEPLVAAKRAERVALDAERESVLRMHTAELESDLADYKRLGSAIKRQRQRLLPLADEKISLAMAAWWGGKGSLTELISARSERIDIELKAIALEGEQRQVAARLHYVYGAGEGD